jgi:hypothetical protein
MPWWQTALAAVILLGGGLTIAKLRNERASRRDVSATAISAAPVMPNPAPEPAVAAPPVVEAPAPVAEPVAEAPVPAAEPPAQVVPSTVPEPSLPPPPAKDEPPASARKVRFARVERTALAASEPAAVEPVAVAEPAPSEAPAATGLPAQPSREQVTAALNAVVPALQKCVGDRHDTADVTLTVRPGGFVSYAVVSGPYAGSNEGSCIARAVKAAKFPAFTDPSVRITYPFQL